jgi:hypothetical protein
MRRDLLASSSVNAQTTFQNIQLQNALACPNSSSGSQAPFLLLGLLLGQIVTHCEHIQAGGKLAAQIGCSRNQLSLPSKRSKAKGAFSRESAHSIRIERFWRSTNDVEMCFGSEFPA